MMKCYLINLDRSPERLKYMAALFAGLGLEFTRVPAVDGKLLSVEEQQRWLNGGEMCLTAGEIGCFLSHRQCWKAVATGPESYAAIFEDDVRFGRNAAETLSRTDWLPLNADIVKIETSLHPTQVERKSVSKVYGRNVTRLWRIHYGTGGYIISRRAASKLLSLSETLSCPVDHFLFDPRFSGFGSLITYQMSPALCAQEVVLNSKDFGLVFGSTLNRERKLMRGKAPRKGLARFRREISRPFEQFLRSVRLLMKGRKQARILFE